MKANWHSYSTPSDLLTFLELFIEHIESAPSLQIWLPCLSFAKDVASNVSLHKPFIFKTLV